MAPVVSTRLSASDHYTAWKVRWGINRMGFSIAPGLYAIGAPTPASPVLVSANYILSFDALRSSCVGIDAWILVLDTKGVNVWCAAGKGAFGTEELITRICEAKLDQVVAHHKVIVPQLGAPGVAAHIVRRRTGFSVVYGPVRSRDIPAFLAENMHADPHMRRVRFTLYDRLALVPMEITGAMSYFLLVAALFFILSGVHVWGYSAQMALVKGKYQLFMLANAFVCGAIFGPLLLPFLPGGALSLKGFVLGLASAAGPVPYLYRAGLFGAVESVAWILMVPAASSFMLMNFTGATPYTSLSGVKKEMKYALPVQIGCAGAGVLLWLTARCI